jgi:predicted transcriptional regulator of viral defense system
MKFLNFKNKLKDFIVFELSDIQAYEPDFNLVQLTQWQNKGYITKLIKGKYLFSDLKLNEEIQFVIANKLLSPSYISMEMALSWYGVIPEGVYSITSVSTRRTIEYSTDAGNFDYRKIKKEGFFGDVINKVEGYNQGYRIAKLEKAIIDLFYYSNELTDEDDLKALRFNEEVIKNEVDFETLQKYSEAIQNEALKNRISTFINYYQNDQPR